MLNIPGKKTPKLIQIYIKALTLLFKATLLIEAVGAKSRFLGKLLVDILLVLTVSITVKK